MYDRWLTSVNASLAMDFHPAADGQHLEVGLEDVEALGAVLSEGGVAVGQCAEWPASGHPHLGSGRPGAAPPQEPSSPDDPLASSYTPLAGFPMPVAVATYIAVARLTALTALFGLLCTARGAVSVCGLSVDVSHVISLQGTKGVTGNPGPWRRSMPTASRARYVRVARHLPCQAATPKVRTTPAPTSPNARTPRHVQRRPGVLIGQAAHDGSDVVR
jgi:hypothetical protein